jgi:SAM-dependent methyltransferase
VCGSRILHHLDLDVALAEVARVLRPAGSAVFYEPHGQNPAVNAYRRSTPEERTDDEYPFLEEDLVAADDRFGDVRVRGFVLLALGSLLLRGRPGFDALRARLARLDTAIFPRCPRMQRLAWITVVELGRPSPHGRA